MWIICYNNSILTGTAILGYSGSRSNGNEGVLSITELETHHQMQFSVIPKTFCFYCYLSFCIFCTIFLFLFSFFFILASVIPHFSFSSLHFFFLPSLLVFFRFLSPGSPSFILSTTQSIYLLLPLSFSLLSFFFISLSCLSNCHFFLLLLFDDWR